MDGVFDEISMVYLSPATGGATGEPLRVEIQGAGSGTQSWFDHLRLLTRTLSSDPAFQTPPQSQTVALGSSVTLSVVVYGDPPFNYQWQFNGTDIVGETADSLTLTDVQFSDAGDYSVRVSNAFGSITSDPATLEVDESPFILTSPVSQSIFQGDPVTFQVTAAGATPLSYQWLLNDIEIPGATSATLTLAATSISDLGAYSVRVDNRVGSVLSENAQLTFMLAPGQIFIANPSFEDPPLSDRGLTANSVPGWTGSGDSYHVINPVNAYFSNTSEDSTGPSPIEGLNAVALNGSAGIQQNLGVELRQNTEYTLNYLAGHRLGVPFGTPSVRLFAGNTLLAESFPQPLDGVFEESFMTYLSPISSIPAGQHLRIEIQGSGSGAQAWFDHMRLLTRGLSSEPSIQTHPESQTVAQGSSVTLSVSVYGALPFTYQWQYNGTDMIGETADSLTLTDLQFSDAGDYSVRVSNNIGSITSNPAKVVVAESPSILTHPVSQIVLPGTSVTLQVLAAGTEPFTYQWLHNDIEIEDATSETLTIPSVFITDLGDYSVRVANAVGIILSQSAQLSFSVAFDQIFIDNHSFESPSLGDGDLTDNSIPGWTGSGSSYHVINPINAYFGNTSDSSTGTNPIDGQNAAALNESTRISQDLGVVLKANSEYTLVYLAGHRINVSFGEPFVRLLAGSSSLAESFPLPPEGEFIESSMVYQAPPNGGLIGQPLRVEIIGSGPGFQAWFDNLRLLTREIPAEPIITKQPESKVILTGTTNSLTVEVQGAAPFSYQWQFNGTDIVDATSPTLILEEAQLSDSGDYTVVVANTYGNVTSAPAIVTVADPPSIVSNPTNQAPTQGDIVTFEVTASGTEPFSFHWFHNGTEIEGANSSILTISDVQITDSGSYYVNVDNSVGSARSESALLTLIGGSGDLVIPPDFTAQEGSTSSETLVSTYRKQELYEYHLFPSSPILIQQIRWRPDGPMGSSFNTVPFDLELKLSTVQKNANQLSLFFSENTGPDEIIVYDGSITLSSLKTGPGQGPADFDITLPLTTPFLYDPAAGNLLVDVKMPMELQASPVDATSGSSGVGHVLALDPAADQASSAVNQADILELSYSLAPTSPGIINQPQDQMAALGDSATFGVGASGSRPLNYQWLLNDQPLLNQTNQSLLLTDLQASDEGNYTVDVSNDFGSETSMIATLTLLSLPTVVEHPQNITVTEGDMTTFSAIATGDGPLSYQWFFNGVSLTDATQSTLVIPQTQISNAGEYTASVFNPVGSATSKTAILRVLADVGRALIISSATGSRGQTIQVPLTLRAQGTENALGFSIDFNANSLTFENALLGPGATGASLFLNDARALDGRLGFALALPAGTTFPVGPQELVLINFTITAQTAPEFVIVSFVDDPIPGETSDPFAADLTTTYFSDGVYIEEPEGLEGDVIPLPLGNLAISITDWVQVGRFAAQIDTLSSPAQFQRVDCAPRSTLGNGSISVSDWVQTGRYVSGLDPWTTVGGPVGSSSGLTGDGGQHLESNGFSSTKRIVKIDSSHLVSDQKTTIPIILDSLGNENALGFSINFDSAKVRIDQVGLGTDVSNATLLVNTNALALGQVGVIISLPSGRSFRSGSQEIISLTLTPIGQETGVMALGFGNQPVFQEIADLHANVLESNFQASSLEILPTLKITRQENTVILSWPDSANLYLLESTRLLGDEANWKLVEAGAVIHEEAIHVELPLDHDGQYFRLSKQP